MAIEKTASPISANTMSGMKQKTPSDDTDSSIKLVGFSVVLVANSNNPSILNPDFLRYNEIVDASQQVQGPPIAIPGFSQVTFESGLIVKAEPNRVIFEQSGDPLAKECVICPDMAKRYLDKVPHVPYSAIGINPQGFRSSPADKPEKVSTALRDKGTWMSFKDVCPDIHLKTIYKYEKRMIVLEAIEGKKQAENASATPGILFHANIHRDISGTNQQERIEMMSKILGSWEDDLSDFYALVTKLNFRGTAS